jgi:hypothetical protein
VAGLGRFASPLAVRLTNSLNSTLTNTNNAACQRRRDNTSTAAPKPSSRKMPGLNTSQKISQNRTHSGCLTATSCSNRKQDESAACSHPQPRRKPSHIAAYTVAAATAEATALRTDATTFTPTSSPGRSRLQGHNGLMAVYVRKLFGIGKLPDDLRAQVDAEGIVYLADYVAVTRRFSGAVPGLRSAHSVASYVGSLVFTTERVLATLSSLPKLAGRAVDVRWDEPRDGAANAEISPTGLQVDLDIGDVDPRFSGHLSLHYKATISGDVLTGLPRRTLTFAVPPEFVLRAVGVPYRP